MNFYEIIDNKLIVVLGFFSQKLKKLLWLYAYNNQGTQKTRIMWWYTTFG
jgi:hypothetical protein